MKKDNRNSNMIRYTIWFGLLLMCFAKPLIAQETVNKIRLNEGWSFLKGDIGAPIEAFRVGKNAQVPIWTNVTLPHCYNAADAVDPDVNYYQGPAWYRTFLDIDNPYDNGRTILHFEGAGQKTKIFVYDKKVGSHVGGYDEFSVDITDACRELAMNEEYTERFDGKIPLLVRCDNSRDVQLIPSDLSDFNLYGGIYRYLNLVYVPALSAGQVHVKSEIDLSTKKAKVNVNVKLKNALNYRGQVELSLKVKSPQGKVINSLDKTLTSWKETKNVFAFEIEDAKLWSPDNPNLYACSITIKTKHGEHTVQENFGLRKFEFVKKGPFKLNGERLLLRGTHRHEDHAGVAAAMTEEMIVQEMEMMKEMGVNFIRLGHYQQSKIVLEQCDKLGILVWEEIPWCRGGLGNETYKEQARRMLKNMINQHYNHPSVIIWGLGNENDWPGDFDVFDEEAIRDFMKELNELSHKLDPSRKTAIRRCDFCKDIIDVYSPSIWAGWYRGKYTQYQEVSRKNMEEVDHFLHVEWGASNHARRHSDNPDKGLAQISDKAEADERDGDFLMTGGDPRVSKDGDWSESYACNLIDWHLKEQEKMPWLTGAAYWPFKDFSTPLRPNNPVPYVNQKGVIERDFTKKEGYYVFQSYWTEQPMAHIYGHTWTTRWGSKKEKKLVKVYSNCTEAELFLNGVSQGVKKRNSQDFPAAGLRWAVKYKMGVNNLKVIASKDEVNVVDSLTVNYQIGNGVKINKLILEQAAIKNDTALVRVVGIDKDGLMCLDAKNIVRFSLSGDGKLIDNQGTSLGARKVQMYNGRAIIKVKLNDGTSVVSVSSEGLESEFLTISQSNIKLTDNIENSESIEIAPTTAKEIKTVMSRVCDWQLANMPEPKKHWYLHNSWTNATLYTGIMEAYKTTKKRNYFKSLLSFAEEVQYMPGKRFRHADDVCIGQIYAELYFKKKDERMITPIRERFDSLMADPKPGRVDWWWCDALYMSPPALARLYTATGEKKYLDYMNNMWWNTYEHLYDKEEHLFYRDDRFILKTDGSGVREPNGDKVFWSRGNGWVMGGIVRVLQHMPEDYPDRDKYITLLKEMADRIAGLQGNDGLWKSSLLYPEPHKHGETSGSGFYCYALAWGINNEILDRKTFTPIVQKAWTGLVDAVQPSGKLGWVQKIGAAPAEISEHETEVYGVGAFLLAGSEMVKLK